MSDQIRNIVIVGGGLAGAKAAETARAEGFDGAVTIVGDEPHRPYERPPLSKGFLVGETPEQDVYVHAAEDYDDLDIALHLDDPVARIDRDQRTVITSAGSRLHYDRLLLATGASARRLPLGDGDLDGILTLRTLDDSRRLGDALRSVEHVTVIGAGWIGCEVAAAARTLGVEVTIADPLDVPLQRVLGEQVGGVFRDLHADHGVDLRLGVGVSGASGASHVEQVTLTDGATIDTDLVVVGIGVVPRTDLATDAGLKVDDGIVVDETLATSDPAILAAGDVARAWHPGLGMHLRVEHWANALNQGKTAGRNLAGAAETYDRLPYFYSDQYDLGMEYVGHAPDPDRVVIRGDTTQRQFIAFWLDDHDRVAAAMNVNIWDVVDDLKTIVRADQPVARDRLEDPDVPLGDLAA